MYKYGGYSPTRLSRPKLTSMSTPDTITTRSTLRVTGKPGRGSRLPTRERGDKSVHDHFPARKKWNLLLGELGDDVALPEEGVLVAVDLDLGAAELGQHDAVTDGHGEGDGLPVALVPEALADGHDGALVDLGLGLLGDEDAALALGGGLRALDEDAVEQGDESLQGAGLERIFSLSRQ